MQRSPASKQRSLWRRGEPLMLDGYVAMQAVRNVHDGVLVVLVGPGPMGKHMSISHRKPNGQPGRYPTWDEIAHARDEFLPADRSFVMCLPKADEYVSEYPTCFHLVDDDVALDALEAVARELPEARDLVADVLASRRPGWERTAWGLRCRKGEPGS